MNEKTLSQRESITTDGSSNCRLFNADSALVKDARIKPCRWVIHFKGVKLCSHPVANVPGFLCEMSPLHPFSDLSSFHEGSLLLNAAPNKYK